MTRRRREGISKKEPPSTTELLRTALTADEFVLVVSAVFASIDEDGRERLLSSLPEDVAGVVGEVLSGVSNVARPRPTSDRVHAEWEQAFGGIEGLVFETEDEHETYVQQDEHWEPPWLDLYTFCNDMEPFAKKLRSLLPRVMSEGLHPKFDPRDFLVELEDGIGCGLPEWIDRFVDDLVLGPEFTGFLLDHAEIASAGGDADPFDLVESLLELDVVTSHLRLDRNPLRTWFADRPESDARAISEGIAARRDSAPWLEATKAPFSFWAEQARELAARFDPVLELSLARSSMAGNPGLAGPVFRDLFERGEDEELLRLLPVAVPSRHPSLPFDPEETGP